MGSFTPREHHPRPGDFIKEATMTANLRIPVPDPSKDYGMYRAMDAAFVGVHEELEELRRNQGRVGFGFVNEGSNLTKAYIWAVQHGYQGDVLEFGERGMEKLIEGMVEASANGELAESGNRFLRSGWQEYLEAILFGKVWPVIIGKTDIIPELPSRESFGGNIQAYIYGYLDVVTELSKALNKELSRPELTTEAEFALFERYLVIAESIVLRLSLERHYPGYVIANGYGHWMSFPSKLRGAEMCILHVRDAHNLRLSIRRMVRSLKG